VGSFASSCTECQDIIHDPERHTSPPYGLRAFVGLIFGPIRSGTNTGRFSTFPQSVPAASGHHP
jgi:hypothetical protein